MTVRVQPDGYLLELGRDGETAPIATMACRSHEDATELAESICANMRKAYWWSVMPVIFPADRETGPTPKECFDHFDAWGKHIDRLIRESMARSQKNAPRDLAAPADSPEPNGSQPAPMIKINPETGQPESSLPRGPSEGACLNCGAKMGEPHMCTDGEAFHQVVWCGECGAFHCRGAPNEGDGWSVATPEPDAVMQAMDLICVALGMDGWDYAQQVVRGVEALQGKYTELRDDL